jgi:hypothetical protein
VVGGGALKSSPSPSSSCAGSPANKKAKVSLPTHGPRELILPQWYAKHIQNKYTYNHTMPCLAKLKENLLEQVPQLKETGKAIYICRCSGVYCPAHMYDRQTLYKHHSNGVYVAFQVLVSRFLFVNSLLVSN